MLFEDCCGCHVAKLDVGGKNENRETTVVSMLERQDTRM